MAQHTPGKWRVRHARGDGDGCIVDNAGLRIALMMHTANGDLWPGGEQRANARLIAAAPELLAALEKLVAATVTSEVGIGVRLAQHDALEAARAAIAKATGE